jgi:nicotinate phosphoribosyltransferase
VAIVLSSQLDELTIMQIRNQIADEAPHYGVDTDHTLSRLVYGVGTHMVTSHGDSSFDGVYKIVAVEDEHGVWQPAMKISDSPAKVQNPGRKSLWRVYDARGLATADVVALEDELLDQRPLRLVHPLQPSVGRELDAVDISEIEPLLVAVLKDGERLVDLGDAAEAAVRRQHDLERLDPGVRRLVNPHTYHVSVTEQLNQLKVSLAESVFGRA